MNSEKIESLRQLLSTFTLVDDFACTQVCRSVLKSDNKEFIDVVLGYEPEKRAGAMTREQLLGIFLFCACELDSLYSIKSVLDVSQKPLTLHPNFRFGVLFCSIKALSLVVPFCDQKEVKDMLLAFCRSPAPHPDKVVYLQKTLGFEVTQEIFKDPAFLQAERKHQKPNALLLRQIVHAEQTEKILKKHLKKTPLPKGKIPARKI